ncbi:hypothetical protein B0A48_03460 [Cryoendolithus antarcticus]|uniref:Uncharacterized protein n=1 Tax=Cryoendolithus antarcticus TaxID=1507870 RepID=A0A1V8TK24_9PEZI|nr:hypothetical protein B0A48_03460 [Cryoendolithus antarcticus]
MSEHGMMTIITDTALAVEPSTLVAGLALFAINHAKWAYYVSKLSILLSILAIGLLAAFEKSYQESGSSQTAPWIDTAALFLVGILLINAKPPFRKSSGLAGTADQGRP